MRNANADAEDSSLVYARKVAALLRRQTVPFWTTVLPAQHWTRFQQEMDLRGSLYLGVPVPDGLAWPVLTNCELVGFAWAERLTPDKAATVFGALLAEHGAAEWVRCCETWAKELATAAVE